MKYFGNIIKIIFRFRLVYVVTAPHSISIFKIYPEIQNLSPDSRAEFPPFPMHRYQNIGVSVVSGDITDIDRYTDASADTTDN